MANIQSEGKYQGVSLNTSLISRYFYKHTHIYIYIYIYIAAVVVVVDVSLAQSVRFRAHLYSEHCQEELMAVFVCDFAIPKSDRIN